VTILSTREAAGSPAVVLPDHPDYDQARRAWNLVADLRPAAVVEARSAEDVSAAVAIAAEQDLQVAPQTTGHLAAALPDLGRTLLVRTTIGGVEIDAEARRARVGAGAIWQDVAEAAAPHGLAALSGSAHDVGVVGYVLGGGLSWLGRAKGLAANHVHAIEVVTADGRHLRCGADDEPELFWALRGGGGNFGVVTAIEIDLFPVAELYAGMTVWPAAHARELLEAWVDWSRTAPGSATTAFRLLRLPPLPELPPPLQDTPVVVLDGAVLTGDAAEGADALGSLRDIGTPIMDTWNLMPPTGLLGVHMDPPQPVPGIGDGMLVNELDAGAIDAFLSVVGPETVSPLLMAELRQLGGALASAPDGAGARGSLEGAFNVFGVGMPMGPGLAEAISQRVEELLKAMGPWATGTRYVNFAEGGGSAEDAFTHDVYERLRDARRAWDPGERFVGSHRIAPR
jgi:hypothetical protein